MTCQHCHIPLKTARKGAKFCSSACRSAAWRGGDLPDSVLSQINRERQEKGLTPLVRDAALDALARKAAGLRGRFARRHVLEWIGDPGTDIRSARTLAPTITHFGIALVKDASGKAYLVAVLAEAEESPQHQVLVPAADLATAP